MVEYLFVIFYMCVVMLLNLGHQLTKGETCGDGRRRECTIYECQQNGS